MDIRRSVEKYFKKIFSLDLRSIALFRIGLGFLLLIDLILRARDLSAFYTDFGVLPRDVLIEKFMNVWFLSIHTISGLLSVQLVLFFIAGIFAVMLILGYKTKLVSIVSWFLLISIHSRNGMVLQGGDVLLRVLALWAVFLPLGAKWSIDSLKNKETKEKAFLNGGTVGILFQVVFLYVFTALLKTGTEWKNGEAIYYALSIDQFVRPFGIWIYSFPDLMKFLTHAVWYFELLGPFLFFVPVFFGQIRTLTVFAFIFLQAGMGISLALGPFPFISSVAVLPFLPSWFWDKILRKHRFEQKESEQVNKKKNKIAFVFNLIAIFFIFYIFLWNLETIGAYDLNYKMEGVGFLTRIDQKWNMFAPYPLKDDGWYVIPGVLKNGREIDLFEWSMQGKEEVVSWDKSVRVSKTYKNERWRKYMMNLWRKDNSGHREYYSTYLCRKWNQDHFGDEVLSGFEIVFMSEITLPNYKVKEPEKVVIWKQVCSKE